MELLPIGIRLVDKNNDWQTDLINWFRLIDINLFFSIYSTHLSIFYKLLPSIANMSTMQKIAEIEA